MAVKVTGSEAHDAIHDGRVSDVTVTNVGTRVQVAYKGSDWTFTLGHDGKWRLGTVSTWGQVSFVRGDASGLVIIDPDTINLLVSAAGERVG